MWLESNLEKNKLAYKIHTHSVQEKYLFIFLCYIS